MLEIFYRTCRHLSAEISVSRTAQSQNLSNSLIQFQIPLNQIPRMHLKFCQRYISFYVLHHWTRFYFYYYYLLLLWFFFLCWTNVFVRLWVLFMFCQVIIDSLSFELPKAVTKFAGLSNSCLEIANSIIDKLVATCSPRDMLSILCEVCRSDVWCQFYLCLCWPSNFNL